MSWQLTCLLPILRHITKRQLARLADPPAARRSMNRAAKHLFCKPPFLRSYDRPDGLTWISAGPCHPGKLILYFHGGGYVAGGPHTLLGLLGRLSALSAFEICAPRYSLAPEFPFPAAFLDATTAWDRLTDLGYAPSDIVISGDSAGGGLALALLSHLLMNETTPAGAVLFSPWTDLTMSGDSLTRNADIDPLLPEGRITELVDFVTSHADRPDPRQSPLFAEFPNCPPVAIHVAATEILFDDSVRMEQRMAGFGAEVSVHTHPNAPHVWPILDGWLPEARDTLQQAAWFAQTCLADTSRNPSASAM